MHRNANKNKVRSNTYAETRSSVLLLGESLRSWAIKNGFPVGSVYNAVRGDRNGKHAVRIRRNLKIFINGQKSQNPHPVRA